MAHKCYISFKSEEEDYKLQIQDLPTLDIIDKSLNMPIESYNDDYILRTIREDYLSDSTVTIHLIGQYGAENRGAYEQRFIKGELQASLYNGDGNTKNGILGVVLPEMNDAVFGKGYTCSTCAGTHTYIGINATTTIEEFRYNYWIPNNKCFHGEEDRYCVLTSWSSFIIDPTGWIDGAFDKRSAPIASKTKVRP